MTDTTVNSPRRNHTSLEELTHETEISVNHVLEFVLSLLQSNHSSSAINISLGKIQNFLRKLLLLELNTHLKFFLAFVLDTCS